MSKKRAAPAATALLTQATAAWPKRSTKSDGIIPSEEHTKRNPYSDHEPGVAGYCHAVDLTHDPTNGCDCAKIAEAIRRARDPRVKYVIFNGRMYSAYPVGSSGAWAWRLYMGTNRHSAHMHVSIKDTKEACEDTSQWPGIPMRVQVPKPITPRPPKSASTQAKGAPPVLARGDAGYWVVIAQQHLNRAKRPLDAKLALNGKFDAKMEKAVRRFQARRRLVVDGVIGKNTWDALRRY